MTLDAHIDATMALIFFFVIATFSQMTSALCDFVALPPEGDSLKKFIQTQMVHFLGALLVLGVVNLLYACLELCFDRAADLRI